MLMELPPRREVRVKLWLSKPKSHDLYATLVLISGHVPASPELCVLMYEMS